MRNPHSVAIVAISVVFSVHSVAADPAGNGRPTVSPVVGTAVGATWSSGSGPLADDPDRKGIASGSLIDAAKSKSKSKVRTAAASDDLLSTNSGPVMHAHSTYAIFWKPSNWTSTDAYQMSDTYIALVNRFLADVAHDTTAGVSSNAYFASTQYSDSTGPVGGTVTVGGYFVDTNTATNNCTNAFTKLCISDAQITAEIARVIALKGWPVGPSSVYFLFTPKGVGTCAGSTCSFSNLCAYHMFFSTKSGPVYYANIPYAATVPAVCDGGQHPNGDDADATIQLVSHEHNEVITDMAGNGWRDSRGLENGDKCAWSFGDLSGDAGAKWNQTINGNHYFLQQEWSNASKKCVPSGL